MTKNVALLLGGWSVEREVSLTKGRAVEKALIEAGYNVRVIDVDRDLTKLIAALTPKPDVVFNNLHGQGGEDGRIQSVLEILGIPYTHSGVAASAIGMDKPLTKSIASSVGVPVAKGILVKREDVLAGHVMAPPYVVKPPREGSSVGVYIVKEGQNAPAIPKDDHTLDNDVLVEQFIPGRELTIAVLNGQAQAVTEIVSDAEFFDYSAKYSDNSTRYVLPANLPTDVYSAAMDYAERVYKAIGCSGLARCDFRYDDRKGVDGLCFLEINTQPGLTAESIGPSQVVYNGKSFVELVAHLVETALCQSHDTKCRVEEDAHQALSASA
jgi:D-alanine-D-alanine ligase